MTLVKNEYTHPYTPTIGATIAPGGVADIDLSAPQELDAVAIGGLLVLDPSWTPTTNRVGAAQWRGSVATTADLPAAGNAAGDTFTIRFGPALYIWSGSAWLQAQSGGLPLTVNFNPLVCLDAVAPGLNNMRVARMFAPYNNAKLAEVYVQSDTPSGNLRGAVYDNGEALPGGWVYAAGAPAPAAGVRTLAWDGGSVAFTAAAGLYISLGTPNIPGINAGDPIDVGVLIDNATGKLRGISRLAGAAGLPGLALPNRGGTSPKLMWTAGGTGGNFVLPTSIAEAGAGTSFSGYPLIMARWT